MEKKCCAVCGGKAPHRCSGCKEVHYCSLDHQKANWKEHQLNCVAYKEEDDNGQYGKHLVARRNISAGSIILKESPCVIGVLKDEGPPVCLGCSRDLMGQAFVKCPQCKWPMCGSKECWEPGSPHALGECDILKKAGVGGNYTKWVPSVVYDTILVLRCISLVRRPRDTLKILMPGSDWNKLMALKGFSHHRLIRRPRGDYRGMLEDVEEDSIRELVREWIPDNWIPSEGLLKFLCGFVANSFSLPEIHSGRAKGTHALYYVASKIGHSCVPNATKVVTKDGRIIVRATVPITKGTRITLNHVAPLWGTMKRRFHIVQTRFRSCSCERCMDPSELGTFASGIFCRKCPKQEGVLLPENPMDDFSDWICNKCADRKSIEYVINIVEKVGDAWKRLNRFSITECEAFLRKFALIVHPHHYYLADVKLVLCTNYGHIGNTDHKNEKILDKKEAYTLELLKIADVLSPGYSRLRGSLLYHLYAVYDFRFDKLVNCPSTPPKECYSRLKEIHVTLRELLGIISWEPVETTVGGLATQLSQKLKTDESYLTGLGLKLMMTDLLNVK